MVVVADSVMLVIVDVALLVFVDVPVDVALDAIELVDVASPVEFGNAAKLVVPLSSEPLVVAFESKALSPKPLVVVPLSSKPPVAKEEPSATEKAVLEVLVVEEFEVIVAE